MQIHVVKPGQTLFSIAQTYSVGVDRIIQTNQLPNPNNLVTGQALVIPIIGSYHFVQPGDSLYTISEKASIPYEQIVRANGISPAAQLTINTRLYIPARQKTTAEFVGYVESRDETVSKTLEASAIESAPYLTHLAPFSFQALRDGSLKEPILSNFSDIARDNRTILMMVINNLENGQFSEELGYILLNNTSVQNKLLNNITTTAQKYNFKHIHFDFEYLRSTDRETYNQFLRKAKERFHKEGWLLSTSLAPKTNREQKGRWYESHDYKAHGEIVDMMVIMPYEWGYSRGPAMAVSPIGPVRQVLEYAVSEMPSKKIVMGHNPYGYDWTLPFVQGSTAKAISPQRAIQIAAANQVVIEYDEKAQAPFFHYKDQAEKKHEVWFEDARSIQAKFDLLKELNLRGMSYWKLGLSFPQNWLLVSDNFNVRKRS
ncbi:glycosyl hydrolase family 18 protein [Peribacillus asahii]|uniref:glycosyl hydrolase family 18 protein n=1 Tax=Peribacillus asahii TaxID=228899 RepID=UPI002079B370|nr:glycoside hydrolase family 18 protein [Peribacillus asahii]USK69736.1 glycoside hydrolase family 18 protein [Peribacillus asahii]